MFKLLCLVLATVACARAEIAKDRVKALPGFNGTLPNMWSGYIEVSLDGVANSSGSAFVHYIYVESPENTKTAPTVVWQQGGPGGSSLIGFFTELGPLTLNDASYSTQDFQESGIPTVFMNPNSWHNAPANYLFIEHPAPTGFSYCEGECVWDDWNQAIVSYRFYVSFFAQFPEIAGNDFYFTGESYAGVLVPTVSLQILEHRNESNRNTAPWNLKGFALGNDCPGNQVYTCTPYSGWRGTKVALDFRFGHGMISESLYATILEECKDWFKGGKPYPSTDGPTKEGPPEGSRCRELLEDPIRPCLSEAGDTYAMGGGYYLYDTCTADMMSLGEDGLPHPDQYQVPAHSGLDGADPYTDNSGEYACGQERASVEWLNLKSVQDALHVQLVGKSQFAFSTGLNYTFTAGSLLDEYSSKLIPNLRIMQYSGDADPCVPYVGTQRWIESLGMNVSVPWHPWIAPGPHDSGMVAGYTTVYAMNNFTFTTIRNAGHMVPRYRSTQAYHMFKQWLHNIPL